MEFDKIFNVKKTLFFETNNEGKVGLRGKFLFEFKEDEYYKITGISISGLKKKNLIDLTSFFPNLIRITIENTSNIQSLLGIEKFTQINELNIKECTNLMDLSAIEKLKYLKIANFEDLRNKTKILSYLLGTQISELYIHGLVEDLNELSNFKDLRILSLGGHGCDNETLPDIPKVTQHFGLSGFTNLKSANFLRNLDPNIKIRWWGPPEISEMPVHLKNNDAFKSVTFK